MATHAVTTESPTPHHSPVSAGRYHSFQADTRTHKRDQISTPTRPRRGEWGSGNGRGSGSPTEQTRWGTKRRRNTRATTRDHGHTDNTHHRDHTPRPESAGEGRRKALRDTPADTAQAKGPRDAPADTAQAFQLTAPRGDRKDRLSRTTTRRGRVRLTATRAAAPSPAFESYTAPKSCTGACRTWARDCSSASSTMDGQ